SPLREGPKLGAAPVCDNSSPLGCATPPYATVGVPIGGKSAFLLSAELRIHADFILNHLGIVPFVDASRVQDEPKAPLSNGGLEVAAGLGLRYLTAFGPLRIDFAYLVKALDIHTQAVAVKDPATGVTTTLVEPT